MKFIAKARHGLEPSPAAQPTTTKSKFPAIAVGGKPSFAKGGPVVPRGAIPQRGGARPPPVGVHAPRKPPSAPITGPSIPVGQPPEGPGTGQPIPMMKKGGKVKGYASGGPVDTTKTYKQPPPPVKIPTSPPAPTEPETKEHWGNFIP